MFKPSISNYIDQNEMCHMTATEWSDLHLFASCKPQNGITKCQEKKSHN